MSRLFTIIIPTRNLDNLRACAASIRDAGEGAEILAVIDVDRFDPEAMGETFASFSHLAPIQFVSGVLPFCFGRNINRGLEERDVKGDVILMNDDATLVTPGGFRALAEAAEAREGYYGVLSARVRGDLVSPVHKASHANQAIVSDVTSFKAFPFVCVYIPQASIEAVGVLSEAFFGFVPATPAVCSSCGWRPPLPTEDPRREARIQQEFRCPQCGLPFNVIMERVYGGEDDDYCYRLRQAGLKLGVYDGCTVEHGVLPSTFRPGNLGASTFGARSKFYDVHGFAMGSK